MSTALDAPAVAADQNLATLLARMEQKLDALESTVSGFERRLESLDELGQDLMPMANGVFTNASAKLTALEQTGALAFAQETMRVLEIIATSFSADDVRRLGDNVVSILETVRTMTQPEVLGLADRAAQAVRDVESRPPEKIRLLRTLRNPEVRRGMGVMLAVLRELGSDDDEPAAPFPVAEPQ